MLPPESLADQARVRLELRRAVGREFSDTEGAVRSTVHVAETGALRWPEGSVAVAVTVWVPAARPLSCQVGPQACQEPESSLQENDSPPTASSASRPPSRTCAEADVTAGTDTVAFGTARLERT